jgi:hypothetical protein
VRDDIILHFLDIFFHVLHLAVIVVNLTFWMSFRTLRLAQITLTLTMISWIGFGFRYGFGYCFLTDWHWQVKERLGEMDLPASYIKYLFDQATGRDWNPEAIDIGTGIAFGLAVVGCVIQTIRKIMRGD